MDAWTVAPPDRGTRSALRSELSGPEKTWRRPARKELVCAATPAATLHGRRDPGDKEKITGCRRGEGVQARHENVKPVVVCVWCHNDGLTSLPLRPNPQSTQPWV